jgi:type VI secretion system protein ImpE
MSSAKELFQNGQLQAALDVQIQKIKSHPADQAARLFLAELLLFQGDLERARKHLEMLQYESPQAQAGLELIKRAWDAEQERRKVLAGQAQPMGLKESPEHVKLRLMALEQYGQGHLAEGNQLIFQANQVMPQTAGQVDGQKVESFRDADDLFGTVLEVFSRGRYCWVPLEQVEKLNLAEPKSPRDVLFLPAHLEIKGGLEGDVLLPGLYPESSLHDDEEIRLGRATDWLGEDDQPIRGVGGKTMLVRNLTKPLVHIREYLGL